MKLKIFPDVSPKEKVMLASLVILHIWGFMVMRKDTLTATDVEIFKIICYSIAGLMLLYIADKRVRDALLMKFGGQIGKEAVVENETVRKHDKPLE